MEEGQNVAIEYRSADGHPERLPALAADLVRRQVGVIVAITAEAPVLAAKKATASIPIVFAAGTDALATGLVANLSRPTENVTGVSFLNTSLGPKRFAIAVRSSARRPQSRFSHELERLRQSDGF